MAAECPICCERLGGHRKEVKCPFCPQTACSACVRAYLVSDLVDARCMGCRHAWSRDFLDSTLPRTFMLGEYKAHRERVLEQRELALLPGTQDRVPGYREYLDLARTEALERPRLADMRRELDDATHRLWDLRDRARELRVRGASRDVIARARQAIETHKVRLGELRARLVHAQLEHAHRVNRRTRLREAAFALDAAGAAGTAGTAASEPRKSRFVRACPADGCRGFLSEKYKCGTCDARVCPKCHDLNPGAGHACDPDAVASAALIAKDSKPCPSCAAMIYKVSGCSQMFCTSCNTAFDWKTGEIVTNASRIHNPHYYDWLFRTRGQAPAQAAAGAGCRDAFRNWMIFRDADLGMYHRVGRHVSQVELPELRRKVRELENSLELRLAYLVGDVDADAWRRTLQRREKAREKAAAVAEVYEMFVAAADDVFQGVMNAPADDDVSAAKTQLAELVKYADECLARIGKRLNMTCRFVSSFL